MNKLTLLLVVFSIYSSSIFAQSFEGIIEMHQVTANGLEYDLTWYIKEGKIAYEISAKSSRGVVQMRLVPEIKTNSMLIITGNSKQKISADKISAPDDFSMVGAKFKDKGLGANENFDVVKVWQISTDKIISIVEVTTDIDINFSEYKAFFKSDYGLCALAELGKSGFPISSTTTDKDGNVLTQTTLKKVTRAFVPDSYFQ